MAKISINDRSEGSEPLQGSVLNSLLEGACHAIERLGEAAQTLEVIKISPNKTTKKVVPFINVKVVIANNGPNGQSQARTEKDFDMFCNENMAEFMAQGIIRTFQEATAKLADQLDRRAQELRDVLSYLGFRESQTGNDQRCRICGRMPTLEERGQPCPNCAKCEVR